MNKILTLLLLTLSLIKVYAQELNAQFVVNADLVNQTNQQILRHWNDRLMNSSIRNLGRVKNFFLKKKSLVVLYSIYRVTMPLNLGDSTNQSQRTIYDSNYDSPH